MAATGTSLPAEPVGVVQRRPLVLGEELGGGLLRAEPGVVLPHPREDVLGGEQALGFDLVGQQPVRGPAGRHAVRVRRLVERRVDRVAAEAARRLDVVQERRRAERQLDHVVEQLEPGAVAEPHAELPEPPAGQPVAGRQPDVLGLEPAQDLADPRPVVGVALEVAPVRVDRPPVRRAVDVVDGPADRRQPAGDERLAQALRRDRQVGHRREPAEALAEHAPAVDAELARISSAVAHDRVGAEVGQVRRLLGRLVARDHRADRRRSAGAALVEQQHAVVGERAASSSRSAGSSAGSPRTPGRPGGTRGTAGRAPSGAATSRVKTVIVRPSGRAWSSGTTCSRSVRTAPGARYVSGGDTTGEEIWLIGAL